MGQLKSFLFILTALLISRYCLSILVPCDTETLQNRFNISSKQIQMENYKSHPYTDRNLNHFMFTNAPLFFWGAALSNRLNNRVFYSKTLTNVTAVMAFQLQKYNIIEIGCGNGHALSEFNALYPYSRLYCINKSGYEFVQANSRKEMVVNSIVKNITVYCQQKTMKPIVPKVKLMERGVGLEQFPFPNATFDLIYSQYSLDAGKLLPPEIGPAIVRILFQLKMGAIALIFPAFSTMQDTTKSSKNWVVRISSISLDSTHKYSIMLYIHNGGARYKSLFGFAAKRCDNNFFEKRAEMPSKWGCFAYDSANLDETPKIFPKLDPAMMDPYLDPQLTAKFTNFMEKSMAQNVTYDNPSLINPSIKPLERIVVKLYIEMARSFFLWLKSVEVSVEYS